jgi:hypothetical protein
MPPQEAVEQLMMDATPNTTKSVNFAAAETASDSMDDTTRNIITSSSAEPLFLRWSRLQKIVTIKESNSGLLRGSIAAPTNHSSEAFKKQGTVQKTILDKVSGCAAPGEVLAMMG